MCDQVKTTKSTKNYDIKMFNGEADGQSDLFTKNRFTVKRIFIIYLFTYQENMSLHQ